MSSVDDKVWANARRQRQLTAVILYLQNDPDVGGCLVERLEAANQAAWNHLASHVETHQLDTQAQADVIAYFRKRAAQPNPADPFFGVAS